MCLSASLSRKVYAVLTTLTQIQSSLYVFYANHTFKCASHQTLLFWQCLNILLFDAFLCSEAKPFDSCLQDHQCLNNGAPLVGWVCKFKPVSQIVFMCSLTGKIAPEKFTTIATSGFLVRGENWMRWMTHPCKPFVRYVPSRVSWRTIINFVCNPIFGHQGSLSVFSS